MDSVALDDELSWHWIDMMAKLTSDHQSFMMRGQMHETSDHLAIVQSYEKQRWLDVGQSQALTLVKR